MYLEKINALEDVKKLSLEELEHYVIRKSFPDRYIPKELMEENGISVDQIVNEVISIMSR